MKNWKLSEKVTFMLFALASVLALAALHGCSEARADRPNVIIQPEQYTRVGGSAYGHSHTVPTVSGVAGIVAQAAAGGVSSTPATMHLFKWGTLVTTSCVLQTTFCWTMAQDSTIDVTGQMTVPSGNSGPGPCYRIEAGGTHSDTVWTTTFKAAAKVARRPGFCTGNATTIGYPCRVNGDCDTAGVCNTSCGTVLGAPGNCDNVGQDAFDNIRGVYLQTLGGAGTSCFVVEET